LNVFNLCSTTYGSKTTLWNPNFLDNEIGNSRLDSEDVRS